jgi:hypothetical protein
MTQSVADQSPNETRRDYHTEQRLAVRVDAETRTWYHHHRGEAKTALETYRNLVRVARQYGYTVDAYLAAVSAIAHPVLRKATP